MCTDRDPACGGLNPMLEFKPTTDYELLDTILKDPSCYRRMVNDQAPQIEDFSAKPGNYEAVLMIRNRKTVGMFMLIPKGPGQAEIHFCFTPEAWGRTKDTAIRAVKWIWQHSTIDSLIGPVPSYNRLGLQVAKAAGFVPRDQVASGCTKHGKPFDLIVTEATRP